MILSLIVLLVLVLIALYLATQGPLTAVLTLAAGMFSAVLAAGTYEALAGLMSNWHPDFGRGVMFLGVFWLSFSILRFVSDMAVPKDVKLPIWVQRIVGGGVGVLAGWIIIGSTLTGIELLPLPESIGGLGNVAAGVEPGQVKVERSWSTSLVTSLFYTACGGGLDGTAFASVHPDLGAEVVGYRHTVGSGARTSLAPGLVSVRSHATLSTAEVQRLQIQMETGGRPLLVVRTSVDMGNEQTSVSWDSSDKGQVFLASTTQVRLVTGNTQGQTRQYYPIGLLENGRQFKPLDIAKGYTADDYANNKVAHDWVFAVDEGQTPQFIEIKYGGQAKLEGQPAKAYSALALADYPPHKWRADAVQLQVSVKMDGQGVAGAMVWRMVPTAQKDKIVELVREIDKVYSGVEERYERNRSMELMNYGPKEMLPLTDLVRMSLHAKKLSGTGVDGTWQYAAGTLKRAVENAQCMKADLTTNAQGEASGSVAAGDYLLVVVARKEDTMRAWIRHLKVESGQPGGTIMNEAFEANPNFEQKPVGK